MGWGFLDLVVWEASGLCVLKAVVCLLVLELDKGNIEAAPTF